MCLIDKATNLFGRIFYIEFLSKTPWKQLLYFVCFKILKNDFGTTGGEGERQFSSNPVSVWRQNKNNSRISGSKSTFVDDIE